MDTALVTLEILVVRSNGRILMVLCLKQFALETIKMLHRFVAICARSERSQVVGSHFGWERSQFHPLRERLGIEAFESSDYFELRLDWRNFERFHRSRSHCRWPVEVQRNVGWLRAAAKWISQLKASLSGWGEKGGIWTNQVSCIVALRDEVLDIHCPFWCGRIRPFQNHGSQYGYGRSDSKIRNQLTRYCGGFGKKRSCICRFGRKSRNLFAVGTDIAGSRQKGWGEAG